METALPPGEFVEELWGYAREVPMMEHPWFSGIIDHRWTREQILLGEVQHYLRVRTNPIYFGYIATNAVAEMQYPLMGVVLENFMEELAGPRTHVDIMLQFLEAGGSPARRRTRRNLLPARWPPSRCLSAAASGARRSKDWQCSLSWRASMAAAAGSRQRSIKN